MKILLVLIAIFVVGGCSSPEEQEKSLLPNDPVVEPEPVQP